MTSAESATMLGSKQGKFLSRIDDAGKTHRIPVGIVEGARPGGQITIFGGQHGTEYDGIEAVQKLYRTIDPAEVSGRIVIALATHEESFLNWEQFAPTYPSIMEMMMELAQGSDLIINCHGGEFSEGMHPYVICRLLGDETLDQSARKMAQAFGLPYVSWSQYRGEPPESSVRPAWWLWPKKSMADRLRIPEITPEVGERGSRDDQGLMYNGIINVLKTFGYLSGEPQTFEPLRAIGDRYWLTADEDGVFFPSITVGQDVEEGEVVGVVRDYFGELLQTVTAPAAGKVMNMNWGMPVKKGAFLLWLGVIEKAA
ncbi:succinylglutamate desuccinylase/aspartoacylase family protein [Microvirga pudoricolor]|uniref:succinylglutamate desuccinylase/aspartoacylase family protein n=1 Tax=Microvirga pudoricolor TaxID=2778729 RepID=UPI001950BE53|nr:succinylglutamate desuccinylase/aspartoacylase family protein [Microvirga pudoricolor]MBM6596303.1 succinylglutamate desuccinylase/aspartoacylase family protein [Microvirga pudoricolor]